MTVALKNIAETVEKLPSKDRAFLAERLLASLDDSETESQGNREAIRRRDEVRSGRIKSIPASQVYRRIEKLLGL